MKRQNGVILNGELAGVRTATVRHGDLAGTVVYATLMTDHVTYGGHHQVLFVEAQAQEVLAFWNLTDGKLEVGIEGWLRSTPARHDQPASAVVVVDRVLFLNVTQAQRDEVACFREQRRTGDKAAQT
jgi:hypothetical protein